MKGIILLLWLPIIKLQWLEQWVIGKIKLVDQFNMSRDQKYSHNYMKIRYNDRWRLMNQEGKDEICF